MQEKLFYNVYILRSIDFPDRIYKGFTEQDVFERLNDHNQKNVNIQINIFLGK